jgi:hypothetical protein
MKTLILPTLLILTACGSTTQTTGTQTGCDSTIVAEFSTMPAPTVQGLGQPDVITETTQGINHILTWEFDLAHTRITFEYNANYCSETRLQF